MKIISITMVGNEAEIIESFIRYTCQIVDEMWFVSCCSIDNSLEIIRKLISEGLPVRLFLDEDYHISYNQKYTDNKYLKKAALQGNIDWIIPLDADEFLASSENPRKVITSFDENCIYECYWDNYALTEMDSKDKFIPQKLCYRKEGFFGNQITKVIIPAKKVLGHEIFLSTGHHQACGKKLVVKQAIDLKFAHYPCVSENQYRLKINGNSISYIAWTNRGDNEGTHVNKQKALLEEKNIFEVANDYGLDSKDNFTLIKQPLNLSWCNVESIKVNYCDLAITEYDKSLIKIGQLMALKAYINEKKIEQKGKNPIILVYGTGKQAEKLFDGIQTEVVSIMAYIDSNKDKEFTMFHKRIVISPDWIRFFEYDKIVISSMNYFDEMYSKLIDYGVNEDKIVNQNYLLDLMME